MRPVLCSSAVAGLHVAELALEDPKRMLDLGTHLRDDLVDLDLSRFRAAPSARLSHFPFESDGAFPAQC